MEVWIFFEGALYGFADVGDLLGLCMHSYGLSTINCYYHNRIINFFITCLWECVLSIADALMSVELYSWYY